MSVGGSSGNEHRRRQGNKGERTVQSGPEASLANEQRPARHTDGPPWLQSRLSREAADRVTTWGAPRVRRSGLITESWLIPAGVRRTTGGVAQGKGVCGQ